jgi:hypothetical protein
MSTYGTYNLARLSKWTGKKSDWAMWEEQFFARAKRKGYKDIAMGRVVVPGVSQEIPADKTEQAKDVKSRGLMTQRSHGLTSQKELMPMPLLGR